MALAAAHHDTAGSASLFGRAVLFVAVFGYYWITLSPFQDLGLASIADPWAGNSNTLNQVVAIGLFGALAIFALRHPLLRQIAQPHGLLLVLFGWFIVTALLAADPSTAMRRVVMAAMVIIGASVFLLLPRDEKHFAKLLGLSLLLMLSLCYYGVIFMPLRSIHQATDVVEALLAGDWRGMFNHKNVAAPAMAFTVFGGLFVWARWSKPLGGLLIVGALYFLYQTGGKSALAMVPAMLILSWAFERFRPLRWVIAVGGLGLFNLVTVGSAAFPAVKSFVTSMGIDASFTDRVQIWQLAFSAIAKHPITGYGLQSFWQTDSLVYGGTVLQTWAINAANAHNAFLDTVISAGIPGLVLVLIWLVFAPVRDVAKAEETDNDPVLTRLYTRLWLYGLFSAGLESFFFVSQGPVWFMILLGVFGLRYQRRGQLVASRSPVLGGLVHA